MNLKKIIYDNHLVYDFLCWYRQIWDGIIGGRKDVNSLRKTWWVIGLIPISIYGVFYTLYGNHITKADNEKNLNGSYKYGLTFVAIVKDEGPYLIEWIEYHQFLGVDHFLIYDNGSSASTKELLRPYVETGVVEYISYPGE